MSRKRLTLASWLLLALAALCAAPIAALIAWDGRIESTLLLFGDLVYVEIDASGPRIALLLGLPLALVGAALAARRPRTPE
ncbi:MAG TPA: hypothetical protein VEC18_01420 [Myxococcota bacterium]|nr:hypothetical protein [Myxococcota bacterium]